MLVHNDPFAKRQTNASATVGLPVVHALKNSKYLLCILLCKTDPIVLNLNFYIAKF